ncbi:hypothetical protein ACOMHN_005765 [Nucella lapillus]
MTDNRYVAGYAKLGTSSCKKCKTKIEKGALRVGKVVSNPFGDDGGDMKQWFHPSCIFDTFLRARAATKKIEEPDDVEGFGDLRQEDKDVLNQLIDDFQSKSNTTPKKKKPPARSNLPISPPKGTPSPQKAPDDDEPSTSAAGAENADDPNVEKDNSFRQFRRLCADLAEENSYTGKTQLVHTYITKGHSGAGYQGDLYLLLKLLLPGVVKTVYNLNNKQLVKLFSQIFGTDLQEMVTDLDQGDVAETVRVAFDNSRLLMPSKKSALSLQESGKKKLEPANRNKEELKQLVNDVKVRHPAKGPPASLGWDAQLWTSSPPWRQNELLGRVSLRLSRLKHGPTWDLRAYAPILHVRFWRGSASRDEVFSFVKDAVHSQRYLCDFLYLSFYIRGFEPLPPVGTCGGPIARGVKRYITHSPCFSHGPK